MVYRLLVLLLVVISIHAFQSVVPWPGTRTNHVAGNFSVKHRPAQHPGSFFPTALSESNKGDEERELEQNSSSFDSEGFTNYLAPYFLAFIVSLVVTGGFLKFILLDY